MGRGLGIAGAAIGAIIIGAIVVLAVWGKGYRIPSSAMEPTLHCARPAPGCEAGGDDHVLVLTFLGWGRGDIVAFHTPQLAAVRCGQGGTFVKRVIGLPGETVTEKRGFFFVNGRRLDEPYISPYRRDEEPTRTWHVPVGEYFVAGDNRASSCDSRVWGGVPKANVIGRLFVRYWPLGRIGSP